MFNLGHAFLNLPFCFIFIRHLTLFIVIWGSCEVLTWGHLSGCSWFWFFFFSPSLKKLHHLLGENSSSQFKAAVVLIVLSISVCASNWKWVHQDCLRLKNEKKRKIKITTNRGLVYSYTVRGGLLRPLPQSVAVTPLVMSRPFCWP